MKKADRFVVVLILALLAGFAAPVSGRISSLESKVDALIKPYFDARSFNGSVLIAKDGRILLEKSYGMANYELDIPNTPETKFHIASLSKSFTATAVLMLEERGKLSVRDPLSKFVPDFPNGDKITLHHLLTHTGGIARDLPDFDDRWPLRHSLEQLVELIKKAPPEATEPDGKYRYSNNGYRLLAYVIEKVSGKSYGEFLRQNIFDPLGMKDTGHDGDAGRLIRGRASGYVPAGRDGFENAPFLDWTTKTGNGSLYSTVGDLYKFDRALYTEKLLKKTTIEKMYAEPYGWFTGERFDRRVIRYNGNSPGFNADFQRYIDDDVCIVLLSNNYAAVSTMIGTSLAAIVFDRPYRTPEFGPIRRVDEKQLQTFIGNYRGNDQFFFPGVGLKIENKGDYLAMTWSSGATAPLAPLGENRFIDRRFWGIVIFEKNDQGKTDKLIWRYDGRDYVADRID
ncbi:MAG: serine hydrolase domain-containing protein [Pyrinomonadaceae bacterium]